MRVPEIVTVAPLAWSVRVMAPPMPPVAPVTSAVLPVRSNTILPSNRQRRAEGMDILRCPDRGGGGGARDALDETAQHLASADLVKPRHALPHHIADAFAPAHHAGDLLDQTTGDLRRIRD